jgi:uncharacterized protein DUF4232
VRYLVLGAALAVVFAAGTGVAGGAGSAACTLSSFQGAFKVVPGSAGAGNIVYKLRVVNNSGATCAFSTAPALRLLDKHGHALPTHAKFPQTLVATIKIHPGKAAVATARFSPDIPSGGEPQNGPCEKRAFKLRVGVGPTNALKVPVTPHTRVCGRGSMAFHAIHQGA